MPYVWDGQRITAMNEAALQDSDVNTGEDSVAQQEVADETGLGGVAGAGVRAWAEIRREVCGRRAGEAGEGGRMQYGGGVTKEGGSRRGQEARRG